MFRVERFLLNILVWLDEGVSVVTLGDPHETVSSRLGKAARGDSGQFWRYATMPLRIVVDWLFGMLGQKNHCAASLDPNVGGEGIIDDRGGV